jgi:hypothetical protein
VTGYTITIKQTDNNFSSDTVNCDMTLSTDTVCSVPVSVLRNAPYSLAWGSSVYAKVIATNIYGDSVVSNEGNGAIITTNPDPPTSLLEEYA